MKRTIRNITIALLIVSSLIAAWFSGYYAGILLNRKDTKQAEYARAVAAIARTMRCSTEAEHKAGRNHECDPSEITQDAGLTDVDGNQIASR